MKPSQNFFTLVKEFEGCKLSAYCDPASGGLPITIGYGSTYRRDGTRFKLGDTISMAEAEQLLAWDADTKAIVVSALFPKTILSQNQFDAILDFAYNLGCGKFAGSSLFKAIKINPADTDIPAMFGKWIYGDGKVQKGLIRRRAEEVKLYTKK